MECPNCHNHNPAGSRYCQFCRYKMPTAESVGDPAQATIAGPQRPEARQVSWPTTPSHRVSEPNRPINQLGAGGTTIAGIWGPFAAHGTRGRHASWLLDNKGDRAEELHRAVRERFRQREIPDSSLFWRNLRAKGLLVEKRDFYFVKRGISTVALYIAQFGQDLYISLVTYVKGPISAVRVAMLVLMLLFAVFYRYFGFNAALTRSFEYFGGLFDFFGGSAQPRGGFPFFALCVLGPLWLLDIWLLGLGLVYSLYKWLRQRDFLAILRARPNEFQQDDTIALEKAIEETVRQSLDAIEIGRALMPSVQQYGPRDRLI